ncbi:hypothetical protein FRC15_007166 [Serendipita sp. 397]|nr:hypothetical protein FRC15_007166 [Serendipita sp. 397]
MTTLYDPNMNHRNANDPAAAMKYVEDSPASPAATEYFDPLNTSTPIVPTVDDVDNSHNVHSHHHHQHHPHPDISIHEPTPTYEKHAPSFPSSNPQPAGYGYGAGAGAGADTKRWPVVDTGNTSSRRSTISNRSTGSKRVTIANPNQYPYGNGENDDVVLGTAPASVQRSGTWAHGPGTSGTREDVGVSRHASLAERASTAAERISPEKQAALTKAEKKDAKRLSKIIKAEGKAEDKQLKSALKELASLQAAQKKASANESAATVAHNKAAKEEQRATAAYLEAKTRWERATANLKVCEERLDLSRESAQKTTVLLRRQVSDWGRYSARAISPPLWLRGDLLLLLCGSNGC